MYIIIETNLMIISKQSMDIKIINRDRKEGGRRIVTSLHRTYYMNNANMMFREMRTTR